MFLGIQTKHKIGFKILFSLLPVAHNLQSIERWRPWCLGELSSSGSLYADNEGPGLSQLQSYTLFSNPMTENSHLQEETQIENNDYGLIDQSNQKNILPFDNILSDLPWRTEETEPLEKNWKMR